MTRSELQNRLNAYGVDPSAYSLEGGLPNEAYVLDHDRGLWSVYYSERGQRTGESVYPTESEACEALLKMLLKTLGA